MKSHERWFLVSIVLLYVSTFAAFTIQFRNYDDHKRLDRHACELALTNRRVLRNLVEAAAADPQTPSGIRDAFNTADRQLAHLIVHANACVHD